MAKKICRRKWLYRERHGKRLRAEGHVVDLTRGPRWSFCALEKPKQPLNRDGRHDADDERPDAVRSRLRLRWKTISAESHAVWGDAQDQIAITGGTRCQHRLPQAALRVSISG